MNLIITLLLAVLTLTLLTFELILIFIQARITKTVFIYNEKMPDTDLPKPKKAERISSKPAMFTMPAEDDIKKIKAISHDESVCNQTTVEQLTVDKYNTGSFSDIGKRKTQQDAVRKNVFVSSSTDEPDSAVAILCDGMGGTNGGDIASGLCADSMLDLLSKKRRRSDFSVSELLDQAYIIDKQVCELKGQNGKPLGAGTTLVVTVFIEDRLFWLSIGDSRLYIIRGEQIIQMTVDHIYMNKLMQKVKSGELTYEKACSDPQRESLTSYIGCGNILETDMSQVPFNLQHNDIIMLCSDGLYRILNEQEIIRIIKEYDYDMDTASKKLVASALDKENPYQDNTSVVLVKYL